MRTILVTGAAGFIGSAVTKALLERGDSVVGLDNLNDYYSVKLKKDRLKQFEGNNQFTFILGDLARSSDIDLALKARSVDSICHLAAQAGVRYSIDHPEKYIASNLIGTANLFESAQKSGIKQIVFASSSSVYGNSKRSPFKESHSTDKPVSLYAATKKSNELLAHSYHQIHGIKMTGLRFFTVYGPWGRPDMTPIKFSQLISRKEPIDVYNFGKMQRDFTYIDDIADGVIRALDISLDFEMINLGGSSVTELETFITLLENNLGIKAVKNYLPMQPGDVLMTSADTSKAQRLLGWKSKTGLEEGVSKFIDWFKDYYGQLEK